MPFPKNERIPNQVISITKMTGRLVYPEVAHSQRLAKHTTVWVLLYVVNRTVIEATYNRYKHLRAGFLLHPRTQGNILTLSVNSTRRSNCIRQHGLQYIYS